MTAAVLGAAYGSVGSLVLGLDWGPVFLGAGLSALGGLLPDLDSDSGVPVCELFGLAAAITLLEEVLRVSRLAEEVPEIGEAGNASLRFLFSHRGSAAA